MRKELPTESSTGDHHIADFGDQKVDVYKLIHLAKLVPEESVPTAGLEGAMHDNMWEDGHGSPLTPQQLLAELTYLGDSPQWDALAQNHPEWQDEIEKIKNADYAAHPLIVIGENTVLDGAHRLTKALAEKAQTIRIKRFSEVPEEAIITE